MYVPHFNAIPDEAELRALVADVATAQLVTVGPDGFPVLTLLPVLWEGDRVIAHMARANPHWQHIADGAPALVVATGPGAYVSPSWYASKAEHGKVVPTWNYSSVELAGRVRVHDDPDWLRTAVDALVERHEGHRQVPWRTTDAPERYVAGQLRAIVGVEVVVERVAGKAKLSQNRSEADRRGVVAGLRGEGRSSSGAVADAMDGAR